jgi:hypothetical protein
MGWFFLIGLAVAILLLVSGNGLGFLAALAVTFVVLVIWWIVRSLKEQHERDAWVNELEKAHGLQAQFAKESDVLSEKLQHGEKVSPEAQEHYEQTYNALMPLLRVHSHTSDRRLQEVREEQGDYSKQPGIVEACENMHKCVIEGIAKQHLPEMLADAKQTLEQVGAESGRTQELLGQWESLYSVLQEKVAAGDIASEGIKNSLNQILSVSKELFPLLPDHQIDELQTRFGTLTESLKARAAALMAKGAAGHA